MRFDPKYDSNGKESNSCNVRFLSLIVVTMIYYSVQGIRDDIDEIQNKKEKTYFKNTEQKKKKKKEH